MLQEKNDPLGVYAYELPTVVQTRKTIARNGSVIIENMRRQLCQKLLVLTLEPQIPVLL
jgi:hypothetical protein